MNGERADLDPDSRQALEFDAVLQIVASYAATAAGAKRVLSLAPLTDIDAVEAEQSAVEEAVRYLQAEGQLLPARLPDPAPALGVLAVEGVRIKPQALYDLASVLLEAVELRRRLMGLEESEFPLLRRRGDAIPDLRHEARVVQQNLGPDGRIADGASAELGRLRHSLARVGEKLRRQLESFLHAPESEPVVRDDFVTQRNGRYVIPVRSDSPRPVRGIVHAASSSGATVFVEPLESVEFNNEIVRLTEEELEEQERILQGWTQRFRARRSDVANAVDAVEAVDTLQCRARFARDMAAVRPSVRAGGELSLRDIRHPLLDHRLRSHGGACVPFSIELSPSEHTLVLSGPNTGGKTVALKTVGLAVLMAQSGLPVTSREARLPLFRQVRADIGDHQSIEADLSTFSAHVRAVSRFLTEVAPPALFLFDEIGTGTDPAEGAAIAQSVLEALRRPGVTTIATTHQRALKAWAYTTEGAASAALEFDEETLRPTYRIVMGSAGASAGIEIAARLGLDAATVARARELLGADSERAEAAMARLRHLTSEVESRRDELGERKAALAAEIDGAKARAVMESERLQREIATALDQVLKEFREQALGELESIRDDKERVRVERSELRSETRLRRELDGKKRNLVGAATLGELPPRSGAPPEPTLGLKVRIRSLDREGEIVEIRGDRVEVRMGLVSFTVRRSDIEPIAERGKTPPPRVGRPSPGAASRSSHDLEGENDLGTDPPRDLMLLGKTIEDALLEVDKYLDGAVLAGWREVRLVHGHGTGRLRAAIRQFLIRHPHVEAQRPGASNEGGDGATVVTLR